MPGATQVTSVVDMALLGSTPSVDAPAGGPDHELDRAVDLPADMASLEAAQDEKRRLLDAAASAAPALMTGAGALPAGVRAQDDATALLRRFYAGEPAAEVVGHDAGEL